MQFCCCKEELRDYKCLACLLSPFTIKSSSEFRNVHRIEMFWISRRFKICRVLTQCHCHLQSSFYPSLDTLMSCGCRSSHSFLCPIILRIIRASFCFRKHEQLIAFQVMTYTGQIQYRMRTKVPDNFFGPHDQKWNINRKKNGTLSFFTFSN